MVGVIVGLVVVALAAGAVYIKRERLGASGAGLAALRTVALGALLVLLANPTALRHGTGGPPTVLLDASLSLGVTGGRWEAALDTARALAGPDGVILRFGDDVTPFDTAPPAAGLSRLEPALRAAVGRGGPVWVVTDGELRDAAGLPDVLRRSAGIVLLPRDIVPNAALLAAAMDDAVLPGDSMRVTLEVGTWGPLPDSLATLEISLGDRALARQTLTLPPPPGVGRREVWLPAGALRAGTHVVTLTLRASGDREPRDDVRQRLVTVTALPAVVAVVSPADWEGRFLVRELTEVTDAVVRGYARIAPGRWVDMRNQQPVDAASIQRAGRDASLLVIRGDASSGRPAARPPARPTRTWPGGTGDGRLLDGDWYPVRDVPASPLGGRLGSIEWDSLPPLAGLVPVTPGDTEWIGLTARLGRRGAERPVLVGRDSAGVRRLVTTGDGLWRWALRGGAAREAYRTLVAAGVDWLLGSEALRRREMLTATAVVERGTPVVFRWTGDRPPPAEGVPVEITGVDSALGDTLTFDAEGRARVYLDPGAYRWRAPTVAGASGMAVVEEYSSEFPPTAVTVAPTGPAHGLAAFLVGARDRWWLFVLVIGALIGEWAWRIRRGLP